MSTTRLAQTAQSECFRTLGKEHSMFFASKERTLLAKPPFANLLAAGMTDIPQQAVESLRLAKELGFNDAMVIGAIPFDSNQPAHLRVSTNCQRLGPLKHSDLRHHNNPVQAHSITQVPKPAHYLGAVKEALVRFARGELDKVVLSRTVEVDCIEKPEVSKLVENLAKKNSAGFTFSVDLPAGSERPKATTLIGASPELLINKTGNRILANPLAGSEARTGDAARDKQLAQELMNSEKDRREHALVIEAVEKSLKPFCKSLKVPSSPSIIETETMMHLSTVIEGELIDPNTHSLALALAMHPTPAVCGAPRKKAEQCLLELEGFDRDLFTGVVGWSDNNGDGEWVVTIRCAEIDNTRIRLYAGAGVVAGSSPEKELAETGAKFNTMLQALGLPTLEEQKNLHTTRTPTCPSVPEALIHKQKISQHITAGTQL